MTRKGNVSATDRSPSLFRQGDAFDGTVESNCAVLRTEHRLELSPSITYSHGDISEHLCPARQANLCKFADQVLTFRVIRRTQLSVCDNPAFAAYS
jgi:hypothetical protein